MATTKARAKASAQSAGIFRPIKFEAVTAAEVIAISNDVDTNVLIERAGELRVMILGLLAGVNVHLMGPAGTAKSLGLRELARRVLGANYFEKALGPLMPVDAVMGSYDIPRLVAEGVFERNPAGKLPASDLALVDEITRANGPMTDMLLPIMNTTERLVEIDGVPVKSPLRALFTGSNFMPEPDDAHLGAFVDRFTLMQLVHYVQADESFKEMFRRDDTRRRAEAAGKGEPQATITLGQLDQAQSEVNAIKPSDEFLVEYAKLRRTARTDAGLLVSDRRFIELGRVCRASAWLAGRTELIAEDLAVVQHGLWREEDEVPTAKDLCLDYVGHFERVAEELRKEAYKPLAAIEEFRGVVEATPPSEQLDRDVLTKATDTRRMVLGVQQRIADALAEAEKQKKDASALREVGNEVQVAVDWFKAVHL